ncbi:MAG: MBL fold metallo-hydrolase [Actinobacteria bacterium]|nr:MBL fold metallo-hydrolase [Actinomycetota bacterium]
MQEQPPVVFPVADGITAIDTFMGGRARYTAAYLLDAAEPTLVETGPGTSVEPVAESLAKLGMTSDELAHIVLTHIHLDHAGGVGQLAARFPSATVWVHERGAPHLVDPSRLVASTARVWGEQEMRELFGPALPVDKGRVRSLLDADVIRMGDRELGVLDTPGHASHHVALVDSRTGAVFTGDALGIHVPDLPVLRPATPPPEFDLERYVASIERIRAAARSILLFAHFGQLVDAAATCDLAIRRVRDWAAVVEGALRETEDPDELTARLEAAALADIETGAEATLDLAMLEDRLRLLSSIKMNAQGLTRYWKRRLDRKDRELGAGRTS